MNIFLENLEDWKTWDLIDAVKRYEACLRGNVLDIPVEQVEQFLVLLNRELDKR